MRLVALTALCILAASQARAATEVSVCGQSVSGNAFLSATLDCTGFDPALQIDNGELDLAGFGITGGPVRCSGRCRVVGPGSTSDILGERSIDVVGATVVGVVDANESHRSKVTVTDSSVTGRIEAWKRIKIVRSSVVGSGRAGVEANFDVAAKGARVSVVDSDISGHAASGIRGIKVNVENSTVRNNGNYGIWAFGRRSVLGGPSKDLGVAIVRNSEITGNVADGIRATAKAVVEDSDISGNGRRGLNAFGTKVHPSTGSKDIGRAKIARSTIVGNVNDGVEGVRVKADQVTIQANGFHGIESHRSILLRDSTVTGNGTDLVCGVSGPCADLTSAKLPKLVGSSTCETSRQRGSGLPGTSWGICSLD